MSDNPNEQILCLYVGPILMRFSNGALQAEAQLLSGGQAQQYGTLLSQLSTEQVSQLAKETLQFFKDKVLEQVNPGRGS